jgi:ABC-type glycerol-3-phosphate transport system permease component
MQGALKLFKRFSAFKALIFAVLAAYALTILVTLYFGLITAVKTPTDFYLNIYGLPKKFASANLGDAFKLIYVRVEDGLGTRKVYLFEMLYNSLIYAGGSAFLLTAVPCVMAYVSQKYKFRFNRVIYGIVIITMVLPIVGSLPSEYRLASRLGLVDNIFGMFLMKFNFLGIYYLIFHASFKGLSWEYAESAKIDGASHWTIMLRVMLPLVKTIFFTIFILNFITLWNDYQGPLIYLPNYPVAAYGLYSFQHSRDNLANTMPMQMMGCAVLTVPVMLLFLLFQKRLMGNLTMGGLKG